MPKQNLLLVDADLRTLRVLEVSLRKAGYNVASTGHAKEALAMLEVSRPDLVLCDTRLPEMDGFELIREMRRKPELAEIPLMVLSSDVSVETKVRGLEIGVEDYLTKPIYIKELLARVNIVLQRKRREGIEQFEHGGKRKFSGSLADMGVVDLLQTIDNSKKSGVLHLFNGAAEGAIYFRHGAPVAAEIGALHGVRAIYRALVWTDGAFEIDFRDVTRPDEIEASMQGVLMEGLRRLDEWGRLLEQLPNIENVFDVSDTQLVARLAEIPDEINKVLREFDGQRSLLQIVDACGDDEIETLSAVSKLYFEGVIYDTGKGVAEPEMRNAASENEYQNEPDPSAELSEVVLPNISSGPPIISHTLAPGWPSMPGQPETSALRQRVLDPMDLQLPRAPNLPELAHQAPNLMSSQAPLDDDDASHELAPELAQLVRRGKKRKRKRRKSLALLPAVTAASFEREAEAEQEPTDSDDSTAPHSDDESAQEVDENCAQITPSSIAPPPNEPLVPHEELAPQTPLASAPTATSKPPKLPVSMRAPWASSSSTPANQNQEPSQPGDATAGQAQAGETSNSNDDSEAAPSQLPSAETAPAAPQDQDTEQHQAATAAMDAGSALSGSEAAPSGRPQPGRHEPEAAPLTTSGEATPTPEQHDPSADLDADGPAISDDRSVNQAATSPEPDKDREPSVSESAREQASSTPTSKAAPNLPRKSARSVLWGAAAAAGIAVAGILFALRSADTSPKASLLHALPQHVPAAQVAHDAEDDSPAPSEAPAGEDPVDDSIAEQGETTVGSPTQSQASAPDSPDDPAPQTDEPGSGPAGKPSSETGTARQDKPKEQRSTAEQKTSNDAPSVSEVIAKGRALEGRGKMQQALALYQRALSTAPGSSRLLSHLAFLYLNQGKSADAVSHAERAAQADETNSEAWIVLGAAQFQLGKRQAAQEAYRSCADKGRGQYVIECRRMLR